MSLSFENVQPPGAFQKFSEPIKPTILQNISHQTRILSTKNQLLDNKLIINSKKTLLSIALTFFE